MQVELLTHCLQLEQHSVSTAQKDKQLKLPTHRLYFSLLQLYLWIASCRGKHQNHKDFSELFFQLLESTVCNLNYQTCVNSSIVLKSVFFTVYYPQDIFFTTGLLSIELTTSLYTLQCLVWWYKWSFYLYDDTAQWEPGPPVFVNLWMLLADMYLLNAFNKGSVSNKASTYTGQ
jgi:hypothetical protein